MLLSWASVLWMVVHMSSLSTSYMSIYTWYCGHKVGVCGLSIPSPPHLHIARTTQALAGWSQHPQARYGVHPSSAVPEAPESASTSTREIAIYYSSIFLSIRELWYILLVSRMNDDTKFPVDMDQFKVKTGSRTEQSRILCRVLLFWG
jgi:hypothetical protein